MKVTKKLAKCICGHQERRRGCHAADFALFDAFFTAIRLKNI